MNHRIAKTSICTIQWAGGRSAVAAGRSGFGRLLFNERFRQSRSNRYNIPVFLRQKLHNTRTVLVGVYDKARKSKTHSINTQSSHVIRLHISKGLDEPFTGLSMMRCRYSKPFNRWPLRWDTRYRRGAVGCEVPRIKLLGR